MKKLLLYIFSILTVIGVKAQTDQPSFPGVNQIKTQAPVKYLGNYHSLMVPGANYAIDRTFFDSLGVHYVDTSLMISTQGTMRRVADSSAAAVAAVAAVLYQPKENQRLSTTNSPTFQSVTVPDTVDVQYVQIHNQATGVTFLPVNVGGFKMRMYNDNHNIVHLGPFTFDSAGNYGATNFIASATGSFGSLLTTNGGVLLPNNVALLANKIQGGQVNLQYLDPLGKLNFYGGQQKFDSAGNAAFLGSITAAGLGLTLGSDATGDMFYRNSSGSVARLAASNGSLLSWSAGLPIAQTVPNVVASDTGRAPSNLITGGSLNKVVDSLAYVNDSSYLKSGYSPSYWRGDTTLYKSRLKIANHSSLLAFSVVDGYSAPTHIVFLGDSRLALSAPYLQQLIAQKSQLNSLGWTCFFSNIFGSYINYSTTGTVTATRDDHTSSENWGISGGRIDASSGATITIGPKYKFTKFRIWYNQTPGSGSFTYSIDGGSAVTVNASGSSPDSLKCVNVSTGLSGNIYHTIVLTVTSGSVRFYGGDFTNPTQSGFVVDILQSGGSQAAQWNGNMNYTAQYIDSISPALCYVWLGLNDAVYTNPSSASTFINNLQGVISGAQLPQNCSVVLSTEMPIASSVAIQENDTTANYNLKIRALAKSNGYGLFDLANEWTNAGWFFNQGSYQDSVHPTGGGMMMIQSSIVNAILPDVQNNWNSGNTDYRKGGILEPIDSINGYGFWSVSGNGYPTDLHTGFYGNPGGGVLFENNNITQMGFGFAGPLLTMFPTSSNPTALTIYRQGSSIQNLMSVVSTSANNVNITTNNAAADIQFNGIVLNRSTTSLTPNPNAVLDMSSDTDKTVLFPSLNYGQLNSMNSTQANGGVLWNNVTNKLNYTLTSGSRPVKVVEDSTDAYTNLIQNRNSSAQLGNFWINGTGEVDNGLTVKNSLTFSNMGGSLSPSIILPGYDSSNGQFVKAWNLQPSKPIWAAGYLQGFTVTAGAPSPGNILYFNGSNQWTPASVYTAADTTHGPGKYATQDYARVLADSAAAAATSGTGSGQASYLSSNFTTTSTAAVNTGLSITGVSGKKYAVDGYLMVDCSAGSAGAGFTFASSGSITTPNITFFGTTSGTTATQFYRITGDGQSGSAVFVTTASIGFVYVKGVITFTSSGTVNLQALSGSGSNTVTVEGGASYLKATQLN